MASIPPVVLFGYDSSTFTIKVRLALRLKQIPYSFVAVPSMMPRPMLRDNFHLLYRKIPVLAIGREMYCDTSLIFEALEHFFGDGYQSLYPPAADGRNYRPLIRGFGSYWADRPLFRVTTGLIPGAVWRTSFGVDRANLIGHTLDADKLEAKLPRNLVALDLQLSLLEPLLQSDKKWIFSTNMPSAADISLWCQLEWGTNISRGGYLGNLTAAEIPDTQIEGADIVFNAQRYPAVLNWFETFRKYIYDLPSTESPAISIEDTLQRMKAFARLDSKLLLLPTPNRSLSELEKRNGVFPGSFVSIAPDDTGRDNPTLGTVVAMSPEEIVIKPQTLEKPASVEVNLHFPRLGFVVKRATRANL